MGSSGNIQTFIDFKDQVLSEAANQRTINRFTPGIYYGADLSIVSNTSVSVSAFDIEIQGLDGSSNLTTIKSTSSGSNTVTVSTVNVYVVFRWSYTGTANDVPSILAVSVPQTYDLVIGQCVFAGSTLTGFNLANRMDAPTFGKFCLVEPTGVASMSVKVRAGNVSSPTQTYFIPEQLTLLSVNGGGILTAGQSVVAILVITGSGGVYTIYGSPATTGSQVAPNFAGYSPLAQVTLSYGQTTIVSSNIVDTRPFLTLGSGVPTGTISAYGGTSAPGAYLLCDGTSYLRASYPNLYAVIGNAYGTADGTHFNVPDLRGLFIRGVDNGAGNDPDTLSRTALNPGGNTGDQVGSYEADQFDEHTHGLNSANTYGGGSGGGIDNGGTNEQTNSAGGSETRPKNVYCWYLIKT